MIGHVVPWCLSCGLFEHDDEFFDVYGDPLPPTLFAPDRFVEESLRMAVMVGLE